MLICAVCWLTLGWTAVAAAAPSYSALPFAAVVEKRQSQTVNGSLQIDLGYAVYQGVANTTTGLNTWKGYDGRTPQVDGAKPQC